MTHDTINRRDPTGSFRFAGAGHIVARHCMPCGKRVADTRGGSIGNYRGIRTWFCAECKAKRQSPGMPPAAAAGA